MCMDYKSKIKKQWWKMDIGLALSNKLKQSKKEDTSLRTVGQKIKPEKRQRDEQPEKVSKIQMYTIVVSKDF